MPSKTLSNIETCAQRIAVGLQSTLFKNDQRLEACLIQDQSHVTVGQAGEFVRKIQVALIQLDGAKIGGDELTQSKYGPFTAAAVLAFKRKRNIINFAYQTQADNIVGKMTIAALDQEIALREQASLRHAVRSISCNFRPDNERSEA